MGMYTELRFFAEMRRDPPSDVVSALDYLCRSEELDFPLVDQMRHEFFRCPRWFHIGSMDSYCFSADSGSSFRFDRIAGRHMLTIQCNLKNYNSEIEKFVDWVMPYCEGIGPADEPDPDLAGEIFPGTLMGYSRYEESEVPDLIYHDGRKA